MQVSAPGKIILFGEHSVVYDRTGIAAAVDLRTTVVAEKSKEIFVWGNLGGLSLTRPDIDALLKKVESLREGGKFDEIKAMADDGSTGVKVVLAAAMREAGYTSGIKLSYSSDIPVALGLGYSSASFVTAAAAVQALAGKPIDKAVIASCAYIGDVVAHGGTPSGIDNNAVTYGGYIRYKKSEGVTPLEIRTVLPIVIGNTGISSQTSVTVPAVRKLRDADPQKIDAIFDEMDVLAKGGIEAIERGDLEKMGLLMNQNQECLRKLEVSHPALEKLIQASIKAGALGAKLSGKGGGGIMYALAGNEESQKKIADAITKAGGTPIRTKIGVEGVKIL
jgi:mevalonate kinase